MGEKGKKVKRLCKTHVWCLSALVRTSDCVMQQFCQVVPKELQGYLNAVSHVCPFGNSTVSVHLNATYCWC